MDIRTKEKLTQVVQRILEVAEPERIILFGSAARDEMGPESDLDLLVVARPGTHRRRLAQAICRNLIGVGTPADIVVVPPEDLARYGEAVGLVLAPALREGEVIYEATPAG